MTKKSKKDNAKTFTVKTKIDANDIIGLLVDAFDSGATNYWANYAEVVLPENFNVYNIEWLKNPEEWDRVRKVYIAPFVDGGKVILHDNEEENKTYTLDLAAIERGIEVMSTKFSRHWSDFLNQTGDSITGDVFVQCCVLGDVIYG